MRLTSLLTDTAVRQRFRDPFDKPAMAATPDLVAPPVTDQPARVGTAFDYLFRFHLQRVNGEIAEAGRWTAEAARNLLSGEGRGTAETAIASAKAARDDYAASGNLSRRLLEAVIHLAELDAIFRTGRPVSTRVPSRLVVSKTQMLRTFVRFTTQSRAAGQAKKEWDERDRVRYQFFEQLLDKSNKHTNRFSNISPKARGNISASAGNGFSFNYTVRKDESLAFLYMYFGKQRTANDAAYGVFESYRDEIEAQVDYDLQWVQDENRRRLILHRVKGGYEDEDRWHEIHDELARTMDQLESAVEPYLDEARQAAEQKADQEREAGDSEPVVGST